MNSKKDLKGIIIDLTLSSHNLDNQPGTADFLPIHIKYFKDQKIPTLVNLFHRINNNENHPLICYFMNLV